MFGNFSHVFTNTAIKYYNYITTLFCSTSWSYCKSYVYIYIYIYIYIIYVYSVIITTSDALHGGYKLDNFGNIDLCDISLGHEPKYIIVMT